MDTIINRVSRVFISLIETFLPEAIRTKVLMVISKNDLLKRIVKGSFWVAFGQIAVQGLAIIASVINVRCMGGHAFGEYGMLQGSLGMLGILTGTGLGFTITKYIAEFRDKDKRKTGRIVGMSIVFALVSSVLLGIIVFFCATVLAEKVFDNIQMAYFLKIGVLLLLAESLLGMLRGGLTGLEHFRFIALSELCVNLIYVPLSIVLTYWNGVVGFIWAVVIIRMLSVFCFSWGFLRTLRLRDISIKVQGCSQEFHILWQFALPQLICRVMVMPVYWVGQIFLVRPPNSYTELGILNVAQSWTKPVSMLPSFIASVSFPTQANLYGNHEYRKFKKLGLSILVIFAVCAVVPGLVVSVFAPIVMKWYGAEFVGTGGVLVMAITTTVLTTISIPLGQMLWTSNNVKWVIFSAVCEVIAFGVTYCLLYRYGALGFASSMTASMLIRLGIEGLGVSSLLGKLEPVAGKALMSEGCK